MKLTRAGWAVAAAIIVCGLLSLWTVHQGNERERKLADGSKFRLEKVFFGKPEAVQPGGLLEKIKFIAQQAWGKWVSKTVTFTARSSWYMNTTIHTNEDALFIYFSRIDPVTRDYKDVEDMRYAEILDEHNCVFTPTQTGGDDNGRMQSSSPGRTSGGYSIGWFRFEAFPRHEKKFRLRFFDRGGKSVEFTLLNPAPSPNPTNWAVETLPITRKVGDVVFTLTNIKIKKNPDTQESYGHITPTYEIIDGGHKTSEWQALEMSLYDSSGNFASEMHSEERYLCPYEAAWKLRVKFFGSEKALSASNTTWTLRGLQLPEAGTVTSLGGSQEMQGVMVKALAFAGPGSFSYSNGIPAQATPPLTNSTGLVNTPPSRTQTRNASGVVVSMDTITGTVPHLAIDVANLSDNQRITVRATDEQGRDYYAYEWGAWGNRRPFTDQPPEIYYLAKQYGETMRFLAINFPPNVKKIDLTFCIHTCHIAEFIFKPPMPENLPATNKPAKPPGQL